MKMFKLTKKARFALAYPVFALMFIFAQTSNETLMGGLVLAIIGEAIRLWSNGYIGHNKVNRTQKNTGQAPIGRLITAGPYAYVRHPLYLGTLLILAGICVAAANIIFAIIVLGLFVYVYQRKMSEEESLISDEIGAGYADYKRNVPQWIPHRWAFKSQQGTWSWKGIQASKEWKTLIWIAVLFIVLYLRQEIYQNSHASTEPSATLHLSLVFSALILIACDLFLSRKKT
jgi:protein-S-isoprenylcysteine O-methyltransferase Ste14